MAAEQVFTRKHMGWTIHERTQAAQDHQTIQFSDCAFILDYGVKQDLLPVHVIKNGEEEIINYRAKLMDEGTPYRVEWYGMKVALIKKGDTIKMVADDEI